MKTLIPGEMRSGKSLLAEFVLAIMLVSLRFWQPR